MWPFRCQFALIWYSNQNIPTANPIYLHQWLQYFVSKHKHMCTCLQTLAEDVYKIWCSLKFLFSSSSVCLSLHSSACLQTYIGSILAAVNPYQSLSGLYDGTAVERYSRHHLGEIPPHIYAIANECYRSMWKRSNNQCVLIRCVSACF